MFMAIVYRDREDLIKDRKIWEDEYEDDEIILYFVEGLEIWQFKDFLDVWLSWLRLFVLLTPTTCVILVMYLQTAPLSIILMMKLKTC